MATKTFYATRDMKNPGSYGSRMLRAGEPVELSGPQGRLYQALGAVSPDAPTGTAAVAAPAAAPKPRAAPRKRRKRATAKK